MLSWWGGKKAAKEPEPEASAKKGTNKRAKAMDYRGMKVDKDQDVIVPGTCRVCVWAMFGTLVASFLWGFGTG